MQNTTPMTWERLKEKLRAHGVSGWGDELPRAKRGDRTAQLAEWENEGGSTAPPLTQRPTDANR